MTDTLSDLRAGCQRGEMPTFHDLWTSGSARLVDAIKNKNAASRWVDGDAYLDALAALQEALWPGSMVSVWDEIASGRYEVTIRGRPARRGSGGGDSLRSIADGEVCPTLATAWLDAILAGLQLEKDDD